MKTRLSRRLWSILLSIIMVSTLLVSVTGCNKKEKVYLSLWGASEDQEMLSSMVDSFVKHYKSEADIIVTISEESELTCKDTVLFCPEIAADVYSFAGDQLNDLAKNGCLLPITENVDKIMEDNGGRDSAVVQAAMKDGELLAYPCTASNGYFLYYNNKYLTERDVRSLDTILSIAKANKKAFVMDFTSGWYTYGFFKGAGLDVYANTDGKTTTCEWNKTDSDIKGADVLQAMLDIASNDGFKSLSSEDGVAGIKNGDVIAFVSGTWNATAIEELWGENMETTILPEFTVGGKNVQMHSVTGYKMLGVNAHTKEKVWAQRLAEWLTNEENQIERFEQRGEGPSNVNAVKSGEVQASKAIAALSEQAEYAHIQVVTDTYWTASYKLGTEIIAGNPHNKTMQQLLDELVEASAKTPDN